MYKVLGIGWVTSVLGFASVAMLPIPFVFIMYGDNIRGRSKFCQMVGKAKEAEEEEKRPGRTDIWYV